MLFTQFIFADFQNAENSNILTHIVSLVYGFNKVYV